MVAQPTEREVVVNIEGVNKIFGEGQGSTQALQEISLEIAQGEFVSIVGPSGCGKSTLLRIIADLVSPSNGVVQVMGKRPERARLANSDRAARAFDCPWAKSCARSHPPN